MSIGEEFLIQTRYCGPVQTDQSRGLPAPPLEPDFTGTIIKLPDPDSGEVQEIDLSVAIESRESIRTYGKSPLDTGALSYLLWCSQGVKWIFEDSTFRTVPSAGARHAIDTYLCINRVEGLKPGIYRYLALEHSLGVISEDESISDLVYRASLNQKCIQDASVCFIWVADAYRMTWRYGERGYRDIFIEGGHICQNLYLSAEAVSCGVCAIGAFHDDEINHLIDLDGTSRYVIYMAAVGKRDEIPE